MTTAICIATAFALGWYARGWRDARRKRRLLWILMGER